MSFSEANKLLLQRNYPKALEEYDRIEDFVFPHYIAYNKCICHYFLNDIDTAVKELEKLAEENSDYHRIFLFIGIIYRQQQDVDHAILNLQQTLKLKNDCIEAYLQLAELYKLLGDADGYASHILMSVQLGGNIQGLTQVNTYEEMLYENVNPESFELYPQYYKSELGIHFHTLLCATVVDSYALLHFHQIGVKSQFNTKEIYSPKDIIKIGYISNKWNEPTSSEMNFIQPILKHHNKEKFTTYMYNTGEIDIKDTVLCLTQKNIISNIVGDSLDILVDIDGRNNNNHAILVNKLCSLQINYGYPVTSGFDSFDYKVVDPNTNPYFTTDKMFTEKLLYMPKVWKCYTPPENVSGDKLEHDKITMAYTGNFSKINIILLGLWYKILKENEDVVLKIKKFSSSS